MRIDKKSIARWRMRLRIELFGRPSYERYYAFIRKQRLKADTRSMRRAALKASIYSFVLLLVAIVTTNFFVAVDFAFADFTRRWLNPFALFFWAWHVITLPPDPHPTTQAIREIVNAHALGTAIKGILISWLLSIAFANLIYWTNRNDRWLLSTEEGSATWIMPENLAKAGVLPRNYDVYAGFDTSEEDRIKFDANLQTEHQERIAAFTEACRQWEQQAAENADIDVIQLPIYGAHDATLAHGATQTDKSAPWLTGASTLPQPDRDITVPSFD